MAVGQSLPILVVEDDRELRDSIKEALIEAQLEVITASDGKEGLDRLRDRACACVLLDLMMPGLNGWEFRALQQQDPRIADVPVIIISAAATLRQIATSLQVQGFLPKPFAVDQLLSLVKRVSPQAVPPPETHPFAGLPSDFRRAPDLDERGSSACASAPISHMAR